MMEFRSMLRREDLGIVCEKRLSYCSWSFLMKDRRSYGVAGRPNVSTLIYNKIEVPMHRLLLVY